MGTAWTFSSRIIWFVSVLTNGWAAVCSGQTLPTDSAALRQYCEQALQKPADQKIDQLSAGINGWEQARLPVDSIYVNLHLELAKGLNQTQRRPEAVRLLNKIIKAYQHPNAGLVPEDLAKAYQRLGVCYKDDGNFLLARQTLEQGIRMSSHLTRSRWVSYMHSTLAFVLYQSGDYEQALVQAERGVRIGEHANSDRAIANALFEKAKAMQELGRTGQTRPDLERAIRLAEHNKELAYDLSLYYVTLAYVCKAEANPDAGINYFQKAIALNRRLNDSLGIATNSTDLGYFLYDLGRYDAALPALNQALRFSQSPYLTARAFDNLGAVYWKKKQFIPALRSYQRGLRALGHNVKPQSPTDLPSLDQIRISPYKEYLLTLIQDKADTWLDSAGVDNHRQALVNALKTYKMTDQMVDYMRWEHTNQQSKFYWREKTRGMYERAIKTCYRLNNAEQAFQFFEKSRAAMLADKLNELGARQQLSRRQAEQEQHEQQQVRNLQSRLADLKPGSMAYEATLADLGTKQHSLNEFLKQIEASNPAYYRYKYDTVTTKLTDLQRYLADRKASFVTYFVGDSVVYILGVTPSGAVLYRQPARDYQKRVQAFMTLLADADAMNRRTNRDRFLALGNRLYRQILAPLQLPAGPVIVSPDGSFVPFETLSQKSDEPDYLLQKYAFSYTYSARLLLKKSTVSLARTRSYDFLGVAPVAFAPTLGQVTLPGSDAALELIAGSFRSPVLLTGRQATCRAFLTEGAKARVIHLFTHAIADSSGQEPMLYFADTTLKLSDLNDGALPHAQLVVLAACKTGVGANQRGEGVFSLARGFAALGVPSVLTTLWSVQNRATYELTRLFAKHLHEGLSKDIALQRAKQDWLKMAEGADQLPTVWAGLIVVGNTEPLARTEWVWGLAGFVLLAMTGLGIWLWRKSKRVPTP